MSDENDLWECDKKKIIKEFSNPVGKLIKDIKVDVERQNVYDYGKNQGAVEELELDISWLKDLEDYAYLFGHKGEMLNRITMRKEYQNKRLKELKEGVEK
jgi:hypothetical protein